jgi:aminobenzoyl-glutamate utilization protein B
MNHSARFVAAILAGLAPALLAPGALVAAPPQRAASSAGAAAEARPAAEGRSDQAARPLFETIARLDDQTWKAALRIWEWAEPGYQEQKSSALLASMLEEAGFTLRRNVAGIPTAFVASYGSGKPVIALLGEFDALPGLSQEPVPYRKPRLEGGYGHGCGHHLLGAASMSAAIAIAEQLRAGTIQGTVRYYGCPAEEGGSAKVFMVAGGLFDDCDAVLHWHPASTNAAGDRSSLARIAMRFRFHGKPAHAAGAPDEGRSALDAVELTNFAANLLREHIPDRSRIHYVISDGGAAPNIVPEFAEVYYYVRHPSGRQVRELYKRLVKCAEAGALATETRLEVVHEGGIREILPNQVLSERALVNLKALADLGYPASEAEFALKLQSTLARKEPLDQVKTVANRSGVVGMGSTDVGDVSWRVPTAGFNTACWVPGTPGHSWQATACGATPAARRGMNLAARVLAATAWDLYRSPQLIEAAKRELKRRLGDEKYEPLIEPEQKPPLDYRKRTRRSQAPTD